MNIKNIKYNIYQKLGFVFPSYFKSKAFSSLRSAIDPKTNVQPPENELYVLQHFLDSKSTIVDVGANNGLYCYYFQEFIGCSQIYAFEPIPSLNSKLRKWFKNIHFYPYAISNENAEKILRIPYINSVKYETRAKLDGIVEVGENHFDEIKIQTKTLDSIFIPKNICVNFIKIDIEGHEMAAIEGAKSIIAQNHPILMVEIEARHHGDKFAGIIRSIIGLGYNCYFFDILNYRLEAFDKFDLIKHQSIGNSVYVNNFLFFPPSFSIQELNFKIKKTFVS